MKNISKRFEELAINFRNNYFLKARLKLSAYYAGGMLVVLIVFSLLVYSLFVKHISDNFEHEEIGEEEEEEEELMEMQAVEKTKDQLQFILILVDGLTVALTMGAGYYLAGRTLEPLRAAYIRQKNFVADSAHELRTPLAVMKTGAESILESDASTGEYKKLVSEYLDEVNYLSKIVNDLLFLARTDSLKSAKFEKIDLAALARKQINLMRPYAESKGIHLEYDSGSAAHFEGNSIYLKKLVANLVKNAIDYNKAGGTVRVSVEENKQGVVLEVADTGLGMTKEELRNIFDRFYKADQSRAKNSSGAGLGLSIVREIVEAHHGKITVSSVVGKGSRFTALFPEKN